MNSFVLFSAILALAYATEDPFVGSWKEDQYQRQNLNDYLYARGLNWFKRVYVTNANFELTMNIAKEGNTYTVTGKSKNHWIMFRIFFSNLVFIVEGPKYEDYQFNVVVDNVTRTDIDLGQLGGPRKATAEMKGNQLITYLHKIDDGSIDVIAVRTVNAATPNVMKYELKDLTSGTDLIQTLNKQNWRKTGIE